MATISEINPQSLGPLQPIRAPQVGITIPNPLNVQPFFAGQQLIQNRNQQRLQERTLEMRQKELDLQNSELLSRQVDRLLKMSQADVNDIYNEHQTKAEAQAAGGFGLDPTYEKHRQLLEARNTKINEFQDKFSKNFSSLYANGASPDGNAVTRLSAEMGMEQQKLRKSLQDKEYTKYAMKQQRYNAFMNKFGDLAKAGDINTTKVRAVQDLYGKYANGQTNIQEEGELDRILGNPAYLEDASFDSKAAGTSLKSVYDAVTAPEEGARYNNQIPGAPGYVAAEKTETYKDPALALKLTQDAMLQDRNFVKMYETVTGRPAPTSERDRQDFDKFVELKVKPFIPAGGTRVTEIGREIYDPVEALKATAEAQKASDAARGASGVGAGTEDERNAQRELGYYQNQGYDVSGVQPSDLSAYIKLNTDNRSSLYEEVDPKTGELKIYQVEIDKDSKLPVMTSDIDPKTKKPIAGTEHPNKIGNPILVLPKSKTVSSTTPNSTVYGSYAVSGKDGSDDGTKTFVPAVDNIVQTLQRVDALENQGIRHAITKVSENRDQSNQATSPGGDRGIYQFNPANQKAFLTSINQPDWQTAVTKLGDAELNKLQDDYYDREIFDPAIKTVEDKLTNKFESLEFDNPHWDGVKEFIGSTANQSGGWKKIVDNAISKFESKYSPDDFENAKNFLTTLKDERTKYIMSQPPSIRIKAGLNGAGQWEEVGINRPFRDYVGALNLMSERSGNAIPELENILRGGSPVAGQTRPTANPVNGTTSTATPINNIQEDINLHPAIKTAQEVYLRGENPSPAKVIEYLNQADVAEANLNSPTWNKANKELENAEEDLAEVEQKIKTDSKISQRQGKGTISAASDVRYTKALAKRDQALQAVNTMAQESAEERSALLKEQAFPVEAQESYLNAARYLSDAMRTSSAKIDLDFVSPGMEGSITEYEDDPNVFYLETRPDRFHPIVGRDITFEQLQNWIKDNAKPFAFKQSDPVQLRKNKATQPTASVQPNIVNKYYGN